MGADGTPGAPHTLSPQHLQRYVNEFAGKHNVRNAETRAQMSALTVGPVGKRLMYRDLVTANGLPSGARITSRASSRLRRSHRRADGRGAIH